MTFFDVAPCLICGRPTAYILLHPDSPVVCDGCEGGLVEAAGARYEDWEGPPPTSEGSDGHPG